MRVERVSLLVKIFVRVESTIFYVDRSGLRGNEWKFGIFLTFYDFFETLQ